MQLVELVTYLLRSASAGSVPGKLIVIEEGAPTSYVRTGFLQKPTFTNSLKNRVATTRTAGLYKNGNIRCKK